MTRALTDLADMAAMMRQPEQAVRLLGAAATLNEPMSVAVEFAERSGWRRAQTEARAQLDPDAYQRAWNAGCQLSWEDVVAAALEAPANHPPATAKGTSTGSLLSPREAQVLQLLVDGRTDREIAEALFISPRTAQGHVASILNKLGVNSRTAAVAVALQRGLLPAGDDSA
jgi:non-specific serine/threonine protein kinase